jgi:hypothetical protein
LGRREKSYPAGNTNRSARSLITVLTELIGSTVVNDVFEIPRFKFRLKSRPSLVHIGLEICSLLVLYILGGEKKNTLKHFQLYA